MRTKPFVALPSYNSGPLLASTVSEVRKYSQDNWVVIDGSTDSSEEQLRQSLSGCCSTRVISLKENQGKGGAVLEAFRAAQSEGFTHGLVMDADGQHPAEKIGEFFQLARENPEAMILGEPVFGDDAPRERVHGRRVGNLVAGVETLGGGIGDSLFGFRLYPVIPFLEVMNATRSARRFDFDTEVAVRLFWRGVRPINRPVPVRYPHQQQGGITHFHYLRDNLLLVRTHARLLIQMVPQLLKIWQYRARWKR